MTPFFLPGSRGRLLAVHHSPAHGGNRGVLFVPPFAEEMNKSRHMVALQAAALATIGYRVLLLDLYGTGDSGGDFQDARWETWLDDLRRGADWLKAQGSREVTLWGLRGGCLLGVDLLRSGQVDARNLVFWQPVTSGKQMLTQFLRLRMAAGLTGDAPRESVASLREQLRRGDVVEVAGYDLAPELVDAIERRDLAPIPSVARDVSLQWYEVASSPGRGLGPASAAALDAWKQAGARVRSEVVIGEPFWMTQEVTMAPDLLRATTDSMKPDHHEVGRA